MKILEEFEASAWSDYRVALQGRFERGVMVRAVECLVEDVVEDRGGVLVPVLTKHQNSPVTHTRQLRRDTDFGLEPTLRDPYESNMVEIGGSNIDGANEGLFARQDIEINTVVAFYNGTKARLEDYEPDTWETNNYKIFDPDDMPDGTIDIPVWAQVQLPCLSLYLIFLARPPRLTVPPWLTRRTTASSPTVSSWCSTTPSLAWCPASPPSRTSARETK